MFRLHGQQVGVEGGQVRGRLAPEKAALGLRDRPLGAGYRGGDSLRDIALHREQIIDGPVITLGPDVTAGGGFDELGGHANPLANRLDAAFEHVSDAKIAADVSHVRGLALVNFSRIPGDDKQIFGVRQVCDDVLGNPVGKAIPLGIVSNVLERQDRD